MTTVAQQTDSVVVTTPRALPTYDGPEVARSLHPQVRQAADSAIPWVITDVLPPGLALLVSPPKIGKSWFRLGIEQAVAYGTDFMGIETGRRRNVISISLEDSLRRIGTRHRELTPDDLVPDDVVLDQYTAWPGESFDQRCTWLEATLSQARELGEPVAMVTIDPLRKFTGGKPADRGVYEWDSYVGRRLNEIGMRYECAILVPHHTNKPFVMTHHEIDWVQRISGSAALAGSATTLMYLEYTRGGDRGYFHVTGWDTPDQAIPVRCVGGRWSRGDEIDVEAERRTGVPGVILRLLVEHGPLTLAELREALPSVEDGTIKRALSRLYKAGDIGHDALTHLWSRSALQEARERSAELEAAGAAARDAGMTVDSVPRPRQWSDGYLSANIPLPVVNADTWYTHDPEQQDQEEAGGELERQAGAGEDQEPEGGEYVPEPGPASVANPAIAQMVATVRDSRLHAVFQLKEEVKAQIGWTSVTLGPSPGSWALFPMTAPAGWVVSFDRKAAYWSSRPWVVPNVLRRCGPLTWEQIRKEAIAGLFQIVVPRWELPDLPSPLGGRPAGAVTLVDRSMLNRLDQLARENYVQFPPITAGFVGKGSENLLEPWLNWCLEQRRTAPDAATAALRKEQQSQAFGSLRIVDPGKDVGVIDRPDWQYAMMGTHAMMMNRYGINALTSGEPLVAVGNTDELVFAVPPDQDPNTWTPKSMQAHVSAQRFDRKYVMGGDEWFRAGGRVAKR